jgi:hypothetical protein
MELGPFLQGSAFPFILLLTGWIKKCDTGNRLKRFYTVIPVALGFVAAGLLTSPWDPRQFLFWALFDGFGAAWVYNFGTKTLLIPPPGGDKD